MLKIERVEELILALEVGDGLSLTFQEEEDILTALREYKQMKTGAAPPPKAERRCGRSRYPSGGDPLKAEPKKQRRGHGRPRKAFGGGYKNQKRRKENS